MEKIVKIKKITKLNKKYDRYDLTVSSTNNFYANGVLIHNTSAVIGKLHVKEPMHIAPYKWLWNKFVDITGKFKTTRFIDYNVTYGPIYSSRTVIKNRYINKEVNSGYYSVDVWSEWGDKIYPYLDDGMTIYGEIVGYITGKDTMIQKHYDYGCEVGQNKLMIYRISTTLDDGSKFEWNVSEVHEWTLRLIERMKKDENDTAFQIHPIDILYSGTLQELYPEIDTENHWHEEILGAMRKDKEHFDMEAYEPLCTHNEVPAEGICLRKDNDPILENFKLKSYAFTMKEALLVDAGEVDIEMADNYGDINNEEGDGEENNNN